MLPGTKVSPRPIGASSRESLENRYYGERQLTVARVTGASPTQWEDWSSIDWTDVYHRVNRLQVRIAKAVKGNETAGSKQLAFEGLEPYARKPARTVLRGRGDWQQSPCYSAS